MPPPALPVADPMFWPPLSNNYKNYLQTVGAGKLFKYYALKFALILHMHLTVLNKTNNGSASKFCKA